jgi:hypothetical protein
MQYVSVSFSACRCSSVVFSSKVGREKKKRVWRQVCEWLSAAVACLPGVVSLLLLEALFMQISGVSELSTLLAHQALFPQNSVHDATATSFPLLQHTGGGDTVPTFSGLCVYLQLMWEVGLPPSPVEFSSLHHSHKLSHFWLLGVRPHSHPLQPGPACLFTVPGGIPLPASSALQVPHHLYYMSLLFSFFPGWGSVCPGGYADLAQGCLWEYHVPLSSPCGPRLPKPSGRGQLVAARRPS